MVLLLQQFVVAMSHDYRSRCRYIIQSIKESDNVSIIVYVVCFEY